MTHNEAHSRGRIIALAPAPFPRQATQNAAWLVEFNGGHEPTEVDPALLIPIVFTCAILVTGVEVPLDVYSYAAKRPHPGPLRICGEGESALP